MHLQNELLISAVSQDAFKPSELCSNHCQVFCVLYVQIHGVETHQCESVAQLVSIVPALQESGLDLSQSRVLSIGWDLSEKDVVEVCVIGRFIGQRGRLVVVQHVVVAKRGQNRSVRVLPFQLVHHYGYDILHLDPVIDTFSIGRQPMDYEITRHKYRINIRVFRG